MNKFFNSSTLFTVVCMFVFTCAINAQDKVVVSGAGSTGAYTNGTYTYAGENNSRPYFSMGDVRIIYRNSGFGNEWQIWDSNSNTVRYFNTSSGNTPVTGTAYTPDVASGTPTVTNLILFTGGSSYSAPAATPGTNNNPIGRFHLDPGANGSNLTGLTINFSGSPSGITAVKLWSSTDNSFNAGSDVQVNSQPYGSTVSFGGSSAIAQAGTYYFITVDLTAGASGTIQGSIPSQASLTVTNGSMENTFTNQVTSDGSEPLPVELSSFTASLLKNSVMLKWQTATEINNSGFEVERASSGQAWAKIGFIQGAGNSNSPKEYSFADQKPGSDKAYYRLKQIDNDGSFEYSQEVLVSLAPKEFELNQNYPNPFNPATSISFSLPESGFASLKVFSTLGEQVAELVNGFMEAGVHEVNFSAENLASGLYIYRLNVDGKFHSEKKMNLLK